MRRSKSKGGFPSDELLLAAAVETQLRDVSHDSPIRRETILAMATDVGGRPARTLCDRRPRGTPGGRARYFGSSTDLRFQIEAAYSRTERSDENFPIRATLRIDCRVHALRSCHISLTRRCASE